MESLAEQPQQERLKSFDTLASVNMLRYDLDNFGQVLPETRQRVYDEELSYLTEGIDRASKTTFALRRLGEDLVYFDDGEWRPYIGMLISGIESAKQEAEVDPRKKFMADKAVDDLLKGYLMQSLAPGQKMTWHSAYPEKETEIFGEEFIRSCSFNTARKMGFIYQATCQDDGTIIFESQTLDRSDEDAFEAVSLIANTLPEVEMNTLVETYDNVLVDKFGGYFYAGRRESEINENAWDEIIAQDDLINYFLQELENIASLDLPEAELQNITKRHVYGTWAAFKTRIDNKKTKNHTTGEILSAIDYQMVAREVQTAFSDFARQGKVLIGCGGAISMLSGEENILNASGEDVLSSIFGSKGVEDKFGSLQFKCQKGHMNTRPRNQLIDKCKTCGISVKC